MVEAMLIAIAAALLCCQAPDPAARVEPPGEQSAAAQSPGGVPILGTLELLELGRGRQLRGHVLRATEQWVFLDVGYEVLKVPSSAVVRRSPAGDGAAAASVQVDEIFAAAELPERSVAEGSATMGEAVVKVESAGGQGSGFVTHADGWVVTNFHVVEGEIEVDVVVFSRGANGFEPRTIRKCKVTAINPEMDLALVKVVAPDGLKLRAVYLGDSEAMEVGDTVYAIGAPIGLDRTVSSGIISVTNRTFEGRSHLQITTPINPGNSGGPLFNLRAEVVGVNSSGYRGFQGLNFAIPSKYVIDFLQNRDAYALDSTRSENGIHYLPAPQKPAGSGDK